MEEICKHKKLHLSFLKKNFKFLFLEWKVFDDINYTFKYDTNFYNLWKFLSAHACICVLRTFTFYKIVW